MQQQRRAIDARGPLLPNAPHRSDPIDLGHYGQVGQLKFSTLIVALSHSDVSGSSARNRVFTRAGRTTPWMPESVLPGNEKTALARQSTPGLRFMCILVPWVPSLSVICSFLRVETGSGSFQEGDTSVITGPFTIGTRGPGCPRSPASIGIVQPGRR